MALTRMRHVRVRAPGYSGTPNFPELFVNFLLQRLNEA